MKSNARRRILTTITLIAVSEGKQHSRGFTDKPHMRNMPETRTLRFADMCNSQILRIGRSNIAVSVTMLGIALPMKKLVESMHLECAFTSKSQEPCTGTQLNITPKMHAVAQARTTAAMILAYKANRLPGKSEQ